MSVGVLRHFSFVSLYVLTLTVVLCIVSLHTPPLAVAATGATSGPRWPDRSEVPPSLATLHYGLTGGWVQDFKASYLAYFLQCALTDYASGKA